MIRHLALASALGIASAASARPSLGGDGMNRIAHYEVLTFSDPGGNGINRGKAIGLFDATPDEVFRIASDFEHYREFAPRVISSKVIDRQGDERALVSLTSDLPWPVSKAWATVQYEVHRAGDDVYRIRFWQVQGSMRRYSGSLLIEPWQRWKSGGTSTVTYELLAEPDSSAPKRLINKQVENAVAKYLHALRQRINEMRRAGRLHPVAPPSPALPSPLGGPAAPERGSDVAKAR